MKIKHIDKRNWPRLAFEYTLQNFTTYLNYVQNK